MLHIFHGPDGYSLKQALDRFRDGLGAGDLLSANTSSLDGDKLTPEKLQAHCDAVPFMAPKRLVVVEGLLTRFEPRRRDAAAAPGPPAALSAFTSWFREYVPRIPPTTELVLVDGDLDQRNPLLPALKSLGQDHRFASPTLTGLQAWVRDRVRQEGGAISTSAVTLLVNLVGPNLWALSSEVDKLCLYAGDRAIEDEDVHALVSQAREYKIWDLTDAIMAGNVSAGARLLHTLLDDGEHPLALLAGIGGQFRMVLHVLALGGLDMKPEDLAKSLGGMHPFRAQKAQAQARGITVDELEAIYPLLLKTDLAIKTGRLSGDLALDLLLAELSAVIKPFGISARETPRAPRARGGVSAS